jgi:hypothetical protein
MQEEHAVARRFELVLAVNGHDTRGVCPCDLHLDRALTTAEVVPGTERSAPGIESPMSVRSHHIEQDEQFPEQASQLVVTRRRAIGRQKKLPSFEHHFNRARRQSRTNLQLVDYGKYEVVEHLFKRIQTTLDVEETHRAPPDLELALGDLQRGHSDSGIVAVMCDQEMVTTTGIESEIYLGLTIQPAHEQISARRRRGLS